MKEIGYVMKNRLVLFVMITIAFLMSVGCAVQNQTDPDEVSSATADRYRENEIREYLGARLDPAIGPRDNSIKGIQDIDIDTYTLKIIGLVTAPVELKYDDIIQLPPYQRKITLYCVEGWQATILWEGALIKDILDIAGVDPKANTVIFHAVDGYTTSLPLQDIIDRQLILAYSANGLPLPDEMGYPFIVVAEDKLGYKWARWVNEIELSDDPSYRGYWEERGYSNDADIQ